MRHIIFIRMPYCNSRPSGLQNSINCLYCRAGNHAGNHARSPLWGRLPVGWLCFREWLIVESWYCPTNSEYSLGKQSAPAARKTESRHRLSGGMIRSSGSRTPSESETFSSAKCNRNIFLLRCNTQDGVAKWNGAQKPCAPGVLCAGRGRDSNAIPFPRTPIPAAKRRTWQTTGFVSTQSVFGPRTHYQPALAA